MDDSSFRQFIAERPALNLSVLADELEMDRVNLHKIINGLRNLQKQNVGGFIRWIKNMDILHNAKWNHSEYPIHQNLRFFYHSQI